MGIKFVNGGFLTTVQDMGRNGCSETGMTVAGVMDTRATALANILVGNEENEAVLEITMMGPTVEFTQDNIIAVTGGDLGAKLDGKPFPRYEAVHVKAGQTLSFMGMFGGSRAYVAFAGGLDIPLVMGSRSTNLKSQIGGYQGRKLGAGDEIGFRDPKTWLPNMKKRRLTPPDLSAKEYTLRVTLGPQDDCFTEKGIETFLGTPYTVSNEYDRMGCRMQGETIEHKGAADIISDGIAFGSVQVPAHGNPIVMMADHQTTGGYTKIGTVISADLPILAQCMPGYKIHFATITVEEAQDIYCKEKAERQALSESLNTEPVPTADEEAVAFAVAGEVAKTRLNHVGTYRITINGKEYTVELEKEEVRFR